MTKLNFQFSLVHYVPNEVKTEKQKLPETAPKFSPKFANFTIKSNQIKFKTKHFLNILYIYHAVSRELRGLDVNGSKYLYTTEYNHADLNVDDNGLWVIYGTQDSNNTIVAKVGRI